VGDPVFVNNRSVFHTGSSGKSLAAFPDPCLCPPPPPTGPVPTPFPNNAVAGDLTKCAKSVLVEGNPAAHKDSYVSTSVGNEPADPKVSGQGGFVTHVVKGAAYFKSHSMDVLFEGTEAVRHLDLTTHNHSNPGNTPPYPMIAKMFAETGTADCGPGCQVTTFAKGCSDGRTPHHIVPKHCFKQRANDAAGNAIPLSGWKSYDPAQAPCVCVTGASKSSTGPKGGLLQHGRIHRRVDAAEAVAGLRDGEANQWTFGEARDAGVAAVKEVVPSCDEGCLKAVVDKGHGNPPAARKLRAHCPSTESSPLRQAAVKGNPVQGL